MKKNTILLIFLSACLFAADFWTKPFGEWTDKDAHRMMENSPWAKSFSMTNPPLETGGGRRNGEMQSADESLPGIAQDGMSGGGGRNRGQNSEDTIGLAPSSILIRWQSALPVREALLRMKYGSEAAGSAEAKKIIGAPEDMYVVGVVGVPQRLLTGVPVQVKRDIIQYSFLSAKGKADLHPSDVQFGDPSQLVDVYLHFPNQTPFTLDEKEVTFTAKFGKLVMRQSFRLKDMVINGKLEL